MIYVWAPLLMGWWPILGGRCQEFASPATFISLLSALCLHALCLSCFSNQKVGTLSFSCNRNTTVGIIRDSLKISYFNLVIQQMRKVKLTKQEVAPRLTGLSPWSRTQVFWSLVPFCTYLPPPLNSFQELGLQRSSETESNVWEGS